MSVAFWNEWSRPARWLFYGLIGVLAGVLGLFGFSGFGFWTPALRWDVLSRLMDMQAPIDAFSDGLLNITATGNAYLVQEQFLAAEHQLPLGLADGLLAGFGLAWVLLLSALPAFGRLRYLIGMGVVLVGLAFCRWEMLELPGLSGNEFFMILAILYGGVSYYFHAFRPDVAYPVRLAVFTVLTLAIAMGVGVLTPVRHPAPLLLAYTLPVLLAYSAAFIFFISPEIIAGLVWLTSESRGEGQAARAPLGVRNFMIASGLYLLNLAFIWLKNTKLLPWDGLVLSPFLVYLITIGIGLWGFRRLVQQQQVVSFREGGLWLYVSLGLLTTLTMTYAFWSANDPLVEVFEDVIVYTHLGMGFVFVFYVLINFWPMFVQQRAIHRVLYKPMRAELVLFRLVGFIVVVVLLASGGMLTLKQAAAGYFNALGDYYGRIGETASAKAFYERSLQQEFQQHKANYALALQAMHDEDQVKATYFFRQATRKQPQPHDYAGMSQAYQQTNLFFEAIKVLQEGIRAFPQNGELKNNLGFLYAQTSIADSAYYYLKAATAETRRHEVPGTNLLALYARNPLVRTADSVGVKAIRPVAYTSYQANALALRLVAPTDTLPPAQPDGLYAETTGGLSVGQFASLYNYALLNRQPDTLLIRRLQQRAANPLNQDFTDALLLAQALTEKAAHQTPTALNRLRQLADGRLADEAVYSHLQGIWLLEAGLNRTAADVWATRTDTTSAYYQALAFTRAGDLALAQTLWERIARQDSTAATLKAVLYQTRKPQTDFEKAFYITYRPDDPARGQYWEGMQNPNLKTLAGVALANDFLDKSDWRNAQLMLTLLPKQTVTPIALSLRHVAAMRLAAFRRNTPSAQQVAKQFFLPQHRFLADYWLAQTYDRAQKPKPAVAYYEKTLAGQPLYVPAVVALAYQLRQQKQVVAAYNRVVGVLPFANDQPELLKLYVDLCLDRGLTDYAANGLAQLQRISSTADYQAFRATYQQKVAAIEKNRAQFAQ